MTRNVEQDKNPELQEIARLRALLEEKDQKLADKEQQLAQQKKLLKEIEAKCMPRQ